MATIVLRADLLLCIVFASDVCWETAKLEKMLKKSWKSWKSWKDTHPIVHMEDH